MSTTDFFLKIDGIDGESADGKHKGEIDLLSWSWGETQSGAHAAGGGGGAGKVSMQDFHFTMTVNKATPKLIQACAGGDHIKSAILTCRKAGAARGIFEIHFLRSDYLFVSNGRLEWIGCSSN